MDDDGRHLPTSFAQLFTPVMLSLPRTQNAEYVFTTLLCSPDLLIFWAEIEHFYVSDLP